MGIYSYYDYKINHLIENMEQEIIKAATDVATSTANKGLEKLTDLVFSKKLRQQRRLDHLSTIQDQKDAELIQQGLAEFRDGKFLLITDQIGNPTSPLGLILAQNNENQTENLSQCLSKAYEHLSEKSNEEINDEQISETFFNKWINYGKEVSEEELHDLWGHILAEEIATPNSINYLVLNTLSMMSKNHLEVFYKLIPFICQNRLYCNQHLSAYDNYQNIDYSTLDELIDLNLIKGLNHIDIFLDRNLQEVSQNNEDIPTIGINQNHFIALKLENYNKKLEPHFFLLTTVGYKLWQIALIHYGIDIYFEKFIENLKKIPDFNEILAFELVTQIEQRWKTQKIIKK